MTISQFSADAYLGKPVIANSYFPVVIVGGGQAGLSISYCLKKKGIEHIIFEKNSIAHSWRDKRWDSFCLVTPNWQCMLPGFPYSGEDPHGFMQRDEIVRYVEDYAQSFQPNIKEGVAVEKISVPSSDWEIADPAEENGIRNNTSSAFVVNTSIGQFFTSQVVVATGGYHRPKIPRMAERLPADILQLHSSEYKNPKNLSQAIADRGVLVVGTGQSGCQIAEDLHLAGKQVHLCVGGAPRSPRAYRGKDVVEWLDRLGYYNVPIDEHPQKETVRTKTNHYVTGRGGGREIDLRQFAIAGMQLYGKLDDIQGAELMLQDNLSQNLDYADSVAESIKQTIDKYIEENLIDAPVDPPYESVWQPTDPPLSLNLQSANIGAVIWATGYHMDFSWIEVPAFDGKGYPSHERGITTVEGLYFLGLPWLYTWGSGRFSGVARDANYLANCIALKNKVNSRQPFQKINQVSLGS